MTLRDGDRIYLLDEIDKRGTVIGPTIKYDRVVSHFYRVLMDGGSTEIDFPTEFLTLIPPLEQLAESAE